MGCFLACFGLKKTKKRITSSKTSPAGGRSLGSYVLLDSVDGRIDVEGSHLTSESDQDKEKKQKAHISKVKKKVRFNLDVKAYEPINREDDNSAVYLSEGDEETKWELNGETKSMAGYYYGEDLVALHPASYRYKNCRDNYDDDEENELIFYDLEDSDEEVDGIRSNEKEQGMITGEDFSRPLNPVAGETDIEFIKKQIAPEKDENHKQIHDLQNKKMNSYTRDRSHYVLSVLNPVANLDQWREVKAKPAEKQLKHQKENMLPKFIKSDSSAFKKMTNSNGSRLPGLTVPVHASLSDWLGSMETNKGPSTVAVQASNSTYIQRTERTCITGE